MKLLLKVEVKVPADELQKIRNCMQFTATAAECFVRDALEMLGLAVEASLKQGMLRIIKFIYYQTKRCPELSKRLRAKGFDQECIKRASGLPPPETAMGN